MILPDGYFLSSDVSIMAGAEYLAAKATLFSKLVRNFVFKDSIDIYLTTFVLRVDKNSSAEISVNNLFDPETPAFAKKISNLPYVFTA